MEVAIVGMAGRFPGAPDIATFWDNVCRKLEGIATLNPATVAREGVARHVALDPNYVLRCGHLQGIEDFDAGFFAFSRREAEAIDPQQRLMLELVWEALEDAGIDPARVRDIGVFAGCSKPGYRPQDALQMDAGWLGTPDHFQNAVATDRDYLSTRVSYKLGLQGPSMTIQTACSTSLVAVHMACQSLLLGECEVALAGGVALQVPHQTGYLWQEGGYASRDGRCRPFDASASGTVFGSGAGVVVLRRLEDALRAGDTIVAVIKGSAIGNDGSQKVGFTAPSVAGQARVIRAAQAAAGISARQIGYVEAHGTGTPLGDPIEVAALRLAFGEEVAVGGCALGSVKGNVGHLDTAAGIAGLIKAALSVRERVLPPSVHFERANPSIDFGSSPFYVNTRLRAWRGAACYAGVSSFGIGGTNAHVVLGPARQGVTEAVGVPTPRAQMLTISARDPAALRALSERYEQWLQGPGKEHAMERIAAASALRRAHHSHRIAVVGESAAQWAQSLAQWRESPDTRQSQAAEAEAGSPVWVFCGQGGQWAGMGRALLSRGDGFAAAVDEVDAQVRAAVGWSVRAVLEGLPGAASLSRASVAQLAVFAFQMGLIGLWRALGLRASAVMGHSMGEVAAAYAAGIVCREDAVRIMLARSRLLEERGARGLMALVELTALQAQDRIAGSGGAVWVAAYNGPRSTVLSGDAAVLRALLLQLEKEGVYCRTLSTGDIAGHGAGVASAAQALELELSGLAPQAATIPFISTVRGAQESQLDAAYWAQNMCQPVCFAQAVAAARSAGHRLFLEIGPRPAFATAIADGSTGDVAVLASSNQEDPERQFLSCLAQLYARGFNPNWHALHGLRTANLALPGYPWQKQRYWTHQAPGGVSGQAFSDQRLSAIERLIGTHVSLSLPHPLQIWEGVLDPRTAPFWHGHQVAGVVVLPAAAILDAILTAAMRVYPGSVGGLRDVAFVEAVLVPEGTGRRLQIVLEAPQNDLARFSISSRPGGATAGIDVDVSWRLNAHGCVLIRRPHESAVSEETAGGAGQWLDAQGFYTRLSAVGVQYSGVFRALAEISAGTQRAVGRLAQSLPRDILARSHSCVLLDAALQSLFAIGDADSQVCLPVRIAHLDLFAHGTSVPVCTRASVDRHDTGNGHAAAALHDETGRICVAMSGIETRSFGRRAIEDAEWILESAWQSVELSASAAQPSWRRPHLLLVADAGGMAQKLAAAARERGQSVTSVLAREQGAGCVPPGRFHDPVYWRSILDEFDGTRIDRMEIVWLRSLDSPDTEHLTGAAILMDQQNGCLAVAALIQALAGSEALASARFTHVSRNAVAHAASDAVTGLTHAPLWSFMRTAAIEHGELRVRQFDLDDAADASVLLQALDCQDTEPECVYRQGRWMVPRLRRCVPRMPSAADAPWHLQADASYLVTGGTGGLGLEVARWLIQRGARHIVLAASTPLDEVAAAVLDELRRDADHVRFVCCDIAAEDEVEELFADVARREPPLKGIVHAAGWLQDGLILNLRPSLFYRTMAAKAIGAWHLHTHTRDRRLDFFVMFSSVSALLGAPGQAAHAAANGFLDALAWYRQARGWPATSINWGLWADAGHATRAGAHAALRTSGIDPMRAQTGLRAMELILLSAPAQRAVFKFDANEWLQQYPSFSLPPVMANFVATAQPAAQRADTGAAGRALMDESDPDIRRHLLEELVLRELAVVLRSSTGQLDRQRSFGDANLDSLMSLELRSRLEAALSTSLPATAIWKHPSVERLAAFLEEMLAPVRSVAPPPIAIEPAAS